MEWNLNTKTAVALSDLGVQPKIDGVQDWSDAEIGLPDSQVQPKIGDSRDTSVSIANSHNGFRPVIVEERYDTEGWFRYVVELFVQEFPTLEGASLAGREWAEDCHLPYLPVTIGDDPREY
jgi:hypothetical protein